MTSLHTFSPREVLVYYYHHAMPKSLHGKKLKKKDPAAVALGRRGGLKGGKARMAQLTPEERSTLARKAGIARTAKLTPKRRSELARKAVIARWAKARNKTGPRV